MNRLRLATGSWLNGPSKPGPTKEDIEILEDKDIPATKTLGINEALATKLAVEALDNYRRTHVEVLTSKSYRQYSKASLPFQMFDELDREIFRGVLRGNVYLHWSRIHPHYHGRTSEAGRKYPRVTIELNSFLQQGAPSESVLAVLLHHMTHSYFLICCGFRSEGLDVDMHDLGHGLGFSTLLWKIQDVFRPKTRGPWPDLFRCRTGYQRWPYASSMPCDAVEPPPSGSSSCCWQSPDAVLKETCDDHLRCLRALGTAQPAAGGKDGRSSQTNNAFPISHYLHTIDAETTKPSPILRSQFGHPSADYVELNFDGRAFPVMRRWLSPYPSLNSKFLADQPRTMTVPNCQLEDFQRLYAFLQKGDYPPDISAAMLPRLGLASPTGPPRIQPFRADSKPFMLTDIKVYSLAKKIGFDELRERALARLFAQSVTHNDPMEALEEIYEKIDKETRDKDLRDWVQKWLSVTLADGRSNIALLKDDKQWRERFQKLRQKNGQFLEECDAVQDELLKALKKGPAGRSTLHPPAFPPSFGGTFLDRGRPSSVTPTPLSSPSTLLHERYPPLRGYAYSERGWSPESSPSIHHVEGSHHYPWHPASYFGYR